MILLRFLTKAILERKWSDFIGLYNVIKESVNQDVLASIYAFSSVLTFSAAAIGFTYFSQKVSPLWMNIFKCGVAFLFCLPLVLYFDKQLFWSWNEAWPFYVSGMIGLNIGDWLLLSAYRRIGPARTLVLFGFQPFIAGGFSYFFWDEVIYPIQFVAILFFVLCLFLFSYEKFRKSGHWEVAGLVFAFGGVFLDSVGVILTRYGYNQNPSFSGIDAQYLRTIAALVSFVIFVPFVKINFFKHFFALTYKEKGIAVLSSFLGTFLSLVFYLQAVKIGKLAMVTSIVLTDPMMSTFFESVWLRIYPSRYLWMAIACFIGAMICMFYPHLKT